jgi:hypothetical protein
MFILLKSQKLPIKSLSVVLAFLIVVGVSLQASLQAEVEVNAIGFQSTLEQLSTRMAQEEGFLLTMQFKEPLVVDQTFWTLGAIDDPVHRHISEIGDDFVCLRELAGQAVFIRCVPFSNIASISYIEN